jgi:nitroreductase
MHLFSRERRDYPTLHDQAEDWCIHCGHCLAVCPESAIQLDGVTGEDRQAALPFGPIIYEQFSLLVQSRRSIRSYHNTPIDHDALNHLFELVTWAPTARNLQPVEWIVVNNPMIVQELAQMVADWLETTEQFPVIVDAFKNGEDMLLRNAPCLAIAHTHNDALSPTIDCTIAVEILDMAATAMGLGACWAGFFMNAARHNPAIPQRLALPEDHTIQGALMLGYTDELYLHIPPRNPAKVRLVE